jgi:hypothetical protein
METNNLVTGTLWTFRSSTLYNVTSPALPPPARGAGTETLCVYIVLLTFIALLSTDIYIDVTCVLAYGGVSEHRHAAARPQQIMLRMHQTQGQMRRLTTVWYMQYIWKG